MHDGRRLLPCWNTRTLFQEEEDAVDFYCLRNRTTPMLRQKPDGSWMWQNLSASFTRKVGEMDRLLQSQVKSMRNEISGSLAEESSTEG